MGRKLAKGSLLRRNAHSLSSAFCIAVLSGVEGYRNGWAITLAPSLGFVRLAFMVRPESCGRYHSQRKPHVTVVYFTTIYSWPTDVWC